MNPLESAHERFNVARRARILAAHVAALLPAGASVLDVGTGDGRVAALVVQRRPDVRLRAIDVATRERTAIPVEPFDGLTLPFPDASFDALTFVDVLHHAADPLALLREAVRVARVALVIKDHLCDGFLAHATLRFMDRIGNRRFGVPRPGDYWPERRWFETLDGLGLRRAEWRTRLGLYPWPVSLLFERRLHFVARLELT